MTTLLNDTQGPRPSRAGIHLAVSVFITGLWGLFHSKSGRQYDGTTCRVGVKHAVDRRLLNPLGMLAAIPIVGTDGRPYRVGEKREKYFSWFKGQSTLQPLEE